MEKYTNKFEIADDIIKKTKESLTELGQVGVLVMGKTGVGKSTLINEIFREKLASSGVGKPITDRINKISKEGVPLVLYDTKGIELDVQTQKEALDEIDSFLKMEENEIDICYYLISAQGSRIEDFELREIEKISKHVPVILVLSKYYGEIADEFYDYLGSLMPDQVIVPVLAKGLRISPEIFLESMGLKDLVHKTLALLEEERRAPFINAQQADLDLKVKKARSWAKKYIASSFGVGFAPIPFSDASVLVPMQIGMLSHITAIFGISLDKQSLVSIVAAIGGTGGATFLGRYIVSNIIKMVPGAGTLVGGLISGATASVITTALAMSYIESLRIIFKQEKDNKAVDFEEIKTIMKELYHEYLKNGKDKEEEE